eukprot:351451-Chlamydomonas_euryale.AAC.4
MGTHLGMHGHAAGRVVAHTDMLGHTLPCSRGMYCSTRALSPGCSPQVRVDLSRACTRTHLSQPGTAPAVRDRGHPGGSPQGRSHEDTRSSPATHGTSERAGQGRRRERGPGVGVVKTVGAGWGTWDEGGMGGETGRGRGGG